jgi:hypothetical protein
MKSAGANHARRASVRRQGNDHDVVISSDSQSGYSGSFCSTFTFMSPQPTSRIQ